MISKVSESYKYRSHFFLEEDWNVEGVPDLTFDTICANGSACYPASRCPSSIQNDKLARCNEETQKVCCPVLQIPQNTVISRRLTPIGGYLPRQGMLIIIWFSSYFQVIGT